MTVEAGSPGQTNKTLGNNPIEDGYIIGGIGIATGPAVNISTNITSEKKSGKYGFTDDTIYGKKQKGTIDLNIRNLGGASITEFQSKYKVTIKVPKGVVLGTLNANGKTLDLNQANGQSAFELNNTWTTNFRFDKNKSELSFEINSKSRDISAGDRRSKDFIVKIPFETTADYVGSSTFEVSGQNGFPGDDSLGNVLHKYGNNDSNFYDVPENVNAPSLKYSNEPNYKYKKTLYIDSFTDVDKITVPVGTSLDKIKELSKSKAKEKIESEEYKRKLDETSATATLDDQGTSTGVVATDVAKENAGVIKVPVVHSRDGKNYKNTVDIEVNVVKSITDKLVVFEGDKITNEEVKSSVKPATIDNNLGVVNNPNEADVINTTGKAGEAGLKIPTTVTHEINGTNINETVEVPVTVLPKATGEVEVHKGASVDKVKEVAKTKATALVAATDFTGKLPTGATVTVGDITEAVAETLTNEKGTNKGVVNVPATYTVDGKTYDTTIPVTINVLGSEAKTVYTVEGTKPDANKVKDAVTPGTGGTVQDPTDANLPDTTGKVGATDVVVPTTVKYSTGDETVNVPVTVLPKPEPKGITVLNGTPNEKLIDAIRANVNKAITGLTNVPDGVTPFVTDDAIVTPKTDQNGQQTPVSVTVKYRDKATGKVIDDISVDVDVPVNVVGSTPTSKVVFEGDELTAKDIIDAVIPGENGTKGEPTDLAKDITANPGVKEITVPVTYTDQNGATLTEPVKVKVTVLPKPTPQGIIVAKDSDKEKAKEKALTKAKEAIADGTFKGKLPENVTNVSIDENVDNPDLSDDTDVNVTVKYTVDREEKTTVVKVPVTVVEGVPQIVPVDENNKQPNPENSIDKTEYPDGSTFEYDPKTPVNTTTPGDYTVNVIVKDKEGNPIAEVPATVRVVESYPQFVPVDKDNKQPNVVGSIDPKAFPKDTEFTYETPVDTTTPGEKDVTVVAKIGDEVIAKIPAKVMVVEPKTQYVVADPSKPQPDASKSIDPEQYPDGITFEYKTPVDTTTPGEKDVVVVAKDGDDTLVEVPTKVKVVQGYPQIVPVDEGKKQPSPEDSIDTDDYPDDATFEYKEEVDTSKPGDKKVTVVVKQGDKVLVEVPATVRVVESYPQFVPVDKDKKQPAVEGSIDPKAFPKDTEFTYETPVDTTTPGEKDVTVVAKIGDEVIAKIPAKVMVVEPKTQYVVADPSKPQPDASKSIDPEQYPDGITFEYKTPVDTTTPGEKDVVVVAKDGDDTLVEVPTKVKVVQGYPQIVPVDESKKQPSPEDSIDTDDYPEDATFEYKEEVDTSTSGDKNVTVVVKQGNKVLVEVPATVRVVESYPQFVPVDKDNKQPAVEGSIDPKAFPKDTEFTYETPVDTTTPGEKDVTVVAKIGDEVIAKIPAKVMVVEPKTQYVVADPSKPQPDASKSIDPEQYPDGITFEYKTPVDTTTPGEKDVVVVAKDGDDTLVEVPTKVKVVQGYPQIVPVDEGKKQPSPEDSIDTDDYPDDATFEYKEEVDTSKPGDKKVTVVVKQGDKVLVEVPATVRVVESYPQFVPVDKDKKQPTVEGSIDPKAFPKDTEFTYETPVDTTTPGEKDVVVVAKIGDKVITKVPAKVMVVEPKTQYVPVDKSNKQPDASKSIDPEQYPDGVTFKYKTPVDTTRPGEKDVIVEAKDGEDKLVEVPAKVKVVEGKEQLIPVNPTEKPQARDSITPSDYPEGSTFEYKVPAGQTEPFDATTVGDKPVTVVVKDKNGNVLVEVPTTIKVVEAKPTPIETPVTNTPLTKEDIAKYVKVPEGGKVTNVENIPDLATPGQKNPVKVTVTLPNGKTTIVDVPVNVTPVKGIETPVTKTPLTPEDYTKGIKIPEGGKVTNVENIPDLTTPGQKNPVKVTVELPNGKTITVDVPVNVTPATGIETPVTDTPLTKEDIEKQVKVPDGGKIVEVGKIPEVNTPGDKGTVKVKIELPNGKQIEVDVPVSVTPIKDIVKKLGDPITNEDVEKHIQVPDGGKIISIGDKPSTDIPGKRPSVPVVIELPAGKRVTIKVPVIVIPKTTPIVVEVGTPITEDDVKKHVDLPEGWKVTKVGEIPKTNTPGDKPSVAVELELPDGRKVTVEVSVKVTPKSNHGDSQGNNQGNNGSSTTHIVTRYQDGEGKEISPEENGSHGPKTIEGYEYTGTKTDKNGNVIHTYKKVVTPTRSEQPISPVRPSDSEKPVATPVQTSSTESKQVAETTVSNDKKELPNTGTEAKTGLASLGLLGMLGAFGLVARKKKED